MYYKALANVYHQEFLSQQAFNTLAKRAHFLQVSVQQILQKRNSSMWYKQNGSILLKVLYLGYDSYCCNFGILNIYTIMSPQFKRANQFHFEAEGFWWSRAVSNSSFHILMDNDLDLFEILGLPHLEGGGSRSGSVSKEESFNEFSNEGAPQNWSPALGKDKKGCKLQSCCTFEIFGMFGIVRCLFKDCM